MNHIAGAVDDIHYKTLSKKTISIIGNEIRTEDGFSQGRCIHFVREYLLKNDEICYIFDMNKASYVSPSDNTLTVYIICSPFVSISSPSSV